MSVAARRFSAAGVASGYADAVMALSPLRYWRLEEASGNFIDEVSGVTATVVGTITYSIAGAVDNAVDFVSTGYLTQPGISPQLPTYTLLAWVKVSSGSGAGYRGVFANLNPTLYIYQGKARIYLPNITGTADLRDDTWHMLAATWDGTNVRLYVDAVLEGTAANTQTYAGRQMGKTDFAEYLADGFDEPAIFDYALSGAEISGLFTEAGL